MFHVLRSPKLWLRSPLEMQFSLIVFAFQCTIHFGFSWQGHFKHFVACCVRKCNNLCHIQCFYQLRSPKIWLEMSLAWLFLLSTALFIRCLSCQCHSILCLAYFVRKCRNFMFICVKKPEMIAKKPAQNVIFFFSMLSTAAFDLCLSCL